LSRLCFAHQVELRLEIRERAFETSDDDEADGDEDTWTEGGAEHANREWSGGVSASAAADAPPVTTAIVEDVASGEASATGVDDPWHLAEDDHGRQYWYNARTGDAQWCDEATSSAAATVEEDAWVVRYDGYGRAYWENTQTGKTQWC
jgi:hypothetical protein